MKLLVCFMGLTLLSVVNSYPVNMICVPVCNLNVTTSAEFMNDWLSATGIHQMRNHRGTIINKLLNDASTEVSQLVSLNIQSNYS